MWHFNEIVQADYRGDYRFYIAYDDGVAGEVDLSDYLEKGRVFEPWIQEPLKDKLFFAQAKVDCGTLIWPNEADIAPETLYEKVAAHMQKVAEPVSDYRVWMLYRYARSYACICLKELKMQVGHSVYNVWKNIYFFI